jgi:hypothetical protein
VHTGLFELTEGADGIGLTITLVEVAILVHPFTVTVKLYDPELATVAFVIVGFCTDEVNPFGPLHA